MIVGNEQYLKAPALNSKLKMGDALSMHPQPAKIKPGAEMSMGNM